MKSAPNVGEFGEFNLIRRLAESPRILKDPRILGIGDDCAVLPLSVLFPSSSKGSDERLLISTDLMVEKRHFRTSYFEPYDIGWKLMAVNLSDIAAMGGDPRGVLISLQLRADLPVTFVEELYRGICAIADQFEINVLGGDTSSGNEISLGATIIGVCSGEPLLRSGAQVGDSVFVSGELGMAHTGFRALEGLPLMGVSEQERQRCIDQFLRPAPRIALGAELKSLGIQAAIDVSDGLVQDAGHIAERSGVSIELWPEVIVGDRSPERTGQIMTGGEDYELLFCAPAARETELMQLTKRINLSLTKIGEVQSRSVSEAAGEVAVRDPSHGRVSWFRYCEIHGIKGGEGFDHFQES